MKSFFLVPTLMVASLAAHAGLLERAQTLPQECESLLQNATAQDAPARIYKILDLKKEALTIYYQVQLEKNNETNLLVVRQHAMRAYLLCHRAENSFWIK